jgi:hypothetical protein
MRILLGDMNGNTATTKKWFTIFCIVSKIRNELIQFGASATFSTRISERSLQ